MSIYLAVFGKPRYLGLVDMPDPAPKAGQWIVIKTVRGLEMALLGGALSQEQEAKYRAACLETPSDEHTKGPEPMLQEVEYLEIADSPQLQEYHERRSDEEEVLIRSRQLLREHQLQMKLVDVEYTMDRKKLFFYFTSEQRIDFRAYVRDLAKEFRIRIEMRQIGVRDEAKTVRGIAPCGRPCCCSYWLHRFTPINIRMVKEQNLALNPTKISGICGRLMCCMAYEHSTYNTLWKSLPSPGSKIKTAQGNYVLDGVDLQTETVKVRFPEGREVSIPIVEFADFKETVSRGDAWEKDVSGEQPPRRGLPPSRTPRAQAVKAAESAKEETPKGSIKKAKPEKISLEEHIAGRTGERRPLSEPVADGEKRDSTSAKKRNRRRRGGTASAGTETPAAGRAPEQPQSGQAVLPGRGQDESGKAASNRPPRRERQRPQERRPEQGAAGGQSSPKEGAKEAPAAEKREGRSRRRPRRRGQGGNSGDAGGQEPVKGDS